MAAPWFVSGFQRFIYVYMCVCSCLCTCVEWVHTQRPGENTETLEAAVTDTVGQLACCPGDVGTGILSAVFLVLQQALFTPSHLSSPKWGLAEEVQLSVTEAGTVGQRGVKGSAGEGKSGHC